MRPTPPTITAAAPLRCGWIDRRAAGAQKGDSHAAIRAETLALGGANAATDLDHRVLPESHAPRGRGGVNVRGESLRQGPRYPARQAGPRPPAVRAVFLLAWRCGAGEPRGVTVDEAASG